MLQHLWRKPRIEIEAVRACSPRSNAGLDGQRLIHDSLHHARDCHAHLQLIDARPSTVAAPALAAWATTVPPVSDVIPAPASNVTGTVMSSVSAAHDLLMPPSKFR